jgi:hypothetical protein
VIALRPVRADADAELIHDWVTRPYARFWGMGSATVEDVRAAYAAFATDPHHDAYLGILDARPVLLAETYDPAHSELAAHYAVDPHDIGMHLLVAPPSGPRIHGFTLAAMRAVMHHCLADPDVQRVVVEPDARNAKVHALNAAVGFRVAREIELSDKRALLSYCTRSEFEARSSSRRA